jgi:hypothetical protein
VGERNALMSIEQPGARVSVHFRQSGIEVMVVDLEASTSLVQPTLSSASSWHLVLEGQAVFQQGDCRWELLREQSVHLPSHPPYTVTNPSRERIRLLSVVLAGEAEATPEGGVGSWRS